MSGAKPEQEVSAKKPRLPKLVEKLSEFEISDDDEVEEAHFERFEAGFQEASSASLRAVILEHGRLAGSGFPKLRATDSRFNVCDLSNNDWTQCRVVRSEFFDCKFTGWKAVESNFADCLFSGGHGELVQFQASTFKTVVFENCKFPGVDFRQCKLEKVRFANCDLTESIFAEAELHEVDLRGSDIRGLKARAQDLKGAILGLQQASDVASQLARFLGIELRPD